MSLKNQKGIVRYQGRDDIVCAYGIRDDGKQFYYLDTEGKTLKNGNRIATTALVEAVDPMVKSSNIGVIDSEGKEIIPFNNRSIRLVNDDILLVEPATSVTPSVLDAINVKSDPTAATKLVSTQAQIRDKLNGKVGAEGRYLFNDQFSEATICDINGNNLIDNAFYSFIVGDGKNLYFSKNTADSDIISYSILPPEVQSNVASTNNNQAINVNNVSVSQEVVENALNEKENTNNEMTTPVDNSSQVEGKQQEDNVEVAAPKEEAVQESPLTNLNSVEENSIVGKENENVQNANVASGFEIPSVPVDAPDGVEEEKLDEKNEEDAENSEEKIEEKPIEQEENPIDSSSLDETENASSENDDNNVSDEEIALNDDIMKEANKDESDDDSIIEEESFDLEEDNISDVSKENDYGIDDLAYDDIDDHDLDNLTSVDDLEDDLLEKASVKVDHIDMNDIEDMDGFRSKDNIMADVAKSLTAMMNKCKVLEAQHSEDATRIEKLSSSRRTVIEKNKLLGKKVESLTNKSATISASLSQEKSKNSILENRLHEQKRVIEAQARELELLRPLLQGKDEVVGILADVQALLDETKD